MSNAMLFFRIVVFLVVMIFLAGIATGYANAILFKMFGQREEVSNYLKDDWTTCNMIYRQNAKDHPADYTL